MNVTRDEHQRNVLRLYGRLVALREEWGGQLVLSCGAGAAGSGISAAVSIAGGASLVVEADAAAVKAAMRRGEIDFVVNTLDEALRTLKNEVRQKRPLSVGLIADVDAAMAEMAERGVVADLVMGAEDGVVDGREVWVETRGAALRELDARLVEMFAGDWVRRRWVERASQYLRGGEGRWVWLSEEELGFVAGAAKNG